MRDPATGRRDLTVAMACIVTGLWASSAPAVLYPSFQAELGLGFVGTTALFALHPVVLVAGLLLTGGISDRFGRSRTLAAGLALVALGAAVSTLPAGTPALFASGALEGFGVSLVLPAANAQLGDVLGVRAQGARLAGTVNACAAAAGTVAAFLVGAAFVDASAAGLAQWPIALGAATLVLVCLRADDRERGSAPGTPAALPALPAVQLRTPFWVGAGVGAIGYAVAAVFLSLGAHLGSDLTGGGALTAAACLATFPLASALVPWFTVTLSERASIVLGGRAGAAGTSALLLVDRGGQVVLTLAALTAGAGFGLLTRAGAALVHATVPTGRRADGLATSSITSYSTQAATALVAGRAAQDLGLPGALAVLTRLSRCSRSVRCPRPGCCVSPERGSRPRRRHRAAP
ncbi:hypothetical protein FHR75_004276 [Kineococcus radiotolerans]|uniref:Major facilitator superfamily (MFS) profile domain-containing protein n=1 Tax=Kineococcus radiotolerans TaxID=131568 RepID=A0A7W4TQW8_KINRA|nr:MFS transporter [Kineococcus radiotolerans]MBB2903434.1 hypothetical protein [Kineococcus radiotolerans]